MLVSTAMLVNSANPATRVAVEDDDEAENGDAEPDDDPLFQDEFFDPFDVPPDQQGPVAALTASNTAPPGSSIPTPATN